MQKFSAGCLFCTMGYISMSYSEERERGTFISMSFNLQAFGAAVGGIIPLIINRKSNQVAGVPKAVYIVFIVMQGCGCLLTFALRPPSKITRDDGTQVATIQSRGFIEELKSNLEIFRDWKLLLMLPAFLPSECFLVYAGSVNAYHNSLRARSLLSFVAVVVQIPAGIGLQTILDHDKWSRRTRAMTGLVVVGVPLIAAWTWEVVRTRNYDRSNPPTNPTDWNDDAFIPIFFLFVLNWTASVLWPYVILYFLGCLTNSPRKSANYVVSEFLNLI
jgi:MFS family permease